MIILASFINIIAVALVVVHYGFLFQMSRSLNESHLCETELLCRVM